MATENPSTATQTDSTTVTDPAGDTTTDTEPQFSLDEARRLAALDAAKTSPANNFYDYLTNAKAVERYILSGEITPPTVEEPPPTT